MRDFQEWSPLKAAHEVANFAEQLGINRGFSWQRGGMDVMDRMFSILIILLMSFFLNMPSQGPTGPMIHGLAQAVARPRSGRQAVGLTAKKQRLMLRFSSLV